MKRELAAEKAAYIRELLSSGTDVRTIRATRTDVILDHSSGLPIPDDRHNLLPSEDFYELLQTFDLHEPIEELRHGKRRELWAPNLVTPSEHSSISPWVLAGDPCINRTRIPTAAIFALFTERGLAIREVTELYPGTDEASVADVLALEEKLHGHDRAAA